MDRDQQMVLAAKARAQIVAYLNGVKRVATTTELFEHIRVDTYDKAKLGGLLSRMAQEPEGFITKVLTPKDPDHKLGYTMRNGHISIIKKEVSKERKKKEDVPIEVHVNEKDGSLTIRFGGMLITFSKD